MIATQVQCNLARAYNIALCNCIKCSDTRSFLVHIEGGGVSPEGKCRVFGPGLLMNLFTSRMLANVPRAMTESFPRRAPYELNSRGVILYSVCSVYGTATT